MWWFSQTPLNAMKDVMEIIGPGLEDGCLVTDTAGIKVPVMEWAKECLPDRVTFVGGHPIVFKRGTGPDAADPNLFAGCPYCVITFTGSPPGPGEGCCAACAVRGGGGPIHRCPGNMTA